MIPEPERKWRQQTGRPAHFRLSKPPARLDSTPPRSLSTRKLIDCRYWGAHLGGRAGEGRIYLSDATSRVSTLTLMSTQAGLAKIKGRRPGEIRGGPSAIVRLAPEAGGDQFI